jgi:ABC-2 type transport system ATP-binding protein
MLDVQSLYKRFGTHTAVQHISFQVAEGDSFGLLGPNGAGKSTTISMICGLLEPDEGQVWLDGMSLKQNPQAVKRRIGLVPQNIAVYDNLTPRENLEFWGSIYGIGGSELKDNIEWCLKIAGLKEYEKQLTRTFSGGMKRRLNIAIGMIHRPKLLIMDEPTVGIDPQSRNHILETVRTLTQEGMTVIYTSHYMEEVEYLCTRLAIMDHGQIIAYGQLEDVRQLAGSLTNVTIETNADISHLLLMLQQDLSLKQIQVKGNVLTFASADAAAAVGKILTEMARQNIQPTRIDVQEPSLETAFLHLTGRQLRDSKEGESA